MKPCEHKMAMVLITTGYIKYRCVRPFCNYEEVRS